MNPVDILINLSWGHQNKAVLRLAVALHKNNTALSFIWMEPLVNAEGEPMQKAQKAAFLLFTTQTSWHEWNKNYHLNDFQVLNPVWEC